MPRKSWYCLKTPQKAYNNLFPDKMTENLDSAASAHVVIHPSGHEFLVNGADTLLEAALRSGLALNYGCSSGNCGLCKARVLSGKVQKIHHHDYLLSEAEKDMGYMLMCSHTAVSDLVIEAIVTASPGDIPMQEIETKVNKIELLTDKVMQLVLQTPRSNRLRFFAGQSVSLSLDETISSEYAVASCPCDDRNLEFHIRNLPEDDFARQVFGGMHKGVEVIVRGPIGDFVFDDNSLRTPVFIACNSGFAPIKSLTMHAMALDVHEAIHLHWLATHPVAHYLSNLCRSWDDALDNFHYDELFAPELDEAEIEKILQHIAMIHPDLSQVDMYIAGPEIFISHAQKWLLQNGLPELQLSAAII